MILGERVRLRRPEREDLPRFAAWLNDPAVRQHLALIYPLSLSHEDEWFADQLRAEPATQAFAIDARGDQAGEAAGGTDWIAIGVIGFHSVDWPDRSAELGMLIGNTAFWGMGYGTDATRTLARWAFQQLNLHRLWLRVFADNPRALRCYEKVGFRREGVLRESRFQDGAYLDTVVMGLLRSELGG